MRTIQTNPPSQYIPISIVPSKKSFQNWKTFHVAFPKRNFLSLPFLLCDENCKFSIFIQAKCWMTRKTFFLIPSLVVFDGSTENSIVAPTKERKISQIIFSIPMSIHRGTGGMENLIYKRKSCNEVYVNNFLRLQHLNEVIRISWLQQLSQWFRVFYLT